MDESLLDAEEQLELEALDRQRSAVKAKYQERRRNLLRAIIAEERDAREARPAEPTTSRRSIRDGGLSLTARRLTYERPERASKTTERVKLWWWFIAADLDPEFVEVVYTHSFCECVDEISVTEVVGSSSAKEDIANAFGSDPNDPLVRDVARHLACSARGCEELDVATVVFKIDSIESVINF